jgi:hypothetical protein
MGSGPKLVLSEIVPPVSAKMLETPETDMSCAAPVQVTPPPQSMQNGVEVTATKVPCALLRARTPMSGIASDVACAFV